MIGLVARGCLAAHRPARAFLVGSGVRGTAVVEARSGNGRWQTCDYVRIRGDYDCEGLVTVTDATANLIVDAPPSWPFITPAVVASAYGPGVEVRIRRELRLAGRYRAAASHAVHLDVGAGSASLEPQDAITFDVGVASASLEPQRAIAIDVADEDNVIVWQGAVPFPEALSMTLVAADSLEPARPFLAAPPAMPPFSHP